MGVRVSQLAQFSDIFAIAAGFLLLLTVVGWIAERRMDAPVKSSPRTGARLSATERQLLGDHWFDPVRPYFRRRWESHLRKRLAIAATCGADPDLPVSDNEDRAVVAAGPQDTRRGDSSCQEAA